MENGLKNSFNNSNLKTKVLSGLESNFESYGYKKEYTNLLEPYNDSLTDDKKNHFVFNGQNGERYCLKYDTTMSLSNYINQNGDDIVFPLKRYQMQNSFRNDDELVEFCQCDADIIGSKASSSDAEIINISYSGLINAGLFDFEILLNYVGLNDKFSSVLDKNVLKEVMSTHFDLDEGLKVLDHLVANDEEGKKILDNLSSIISQLPESVKAKCKFDFGMSNKEYYTGIVLKGVTTNGKPKVLLNGGRYDNLIKVNNENVPSVGMAFVLENILKEISKNLKKYYYLNDKIIYYIKDEDFKTRNNIIKSLMEKYPVLSIDSRDIDEERFIDYCKKNHARLIAIAENNNLSLYKVEEYEQLVYKPKKKILVKKEKKDE